MIPKFRAYIHNLEGYDKRYFDDFRINKVTQEKYKLGRMFEEIERIDFEREFIECRTPSTSDFDFKNIHLMQWTGYKDKNDKDIYDKDIVAWTWEDHDPDKGLNCGGIFEVKFVEGCWVLKDLEEECPVSTFDTLLYDVCPSALEVIGNIYENPELLKESENEA